MDPRSRPSSNKNNDGGGGKRTIVISPPKARVTVQAVGKSMLDNPDDVLPEFVAYNLMQMSTVSNIGAGIGSIEFGNNNSVSSNSMTDDEFSLDIVFKLFILVTESKNISLIIF